MPQPQKPTQLKPLKNPPIILIHGFRGAPVGLQAIADPLIAAGYEVHIPAIPPFAGATLEREDYTPDGYARFIANYITEHNLECPILIGHSMGSIVAAATAHAYPELVNHQLILLSPISVRTPHFISAISPLATFLPTNIIDYATTHFLFASPDRDLYRRTLQITHQCSHPRPRTRDLLAATNFSTHHAVSDFELLQNILIIAGEHDRIIAPKQTEHLASKLQAELHFIPNSGHLHNYEAPAATAQLILNFLDK